MSKDRLIAEFSDSISLLRPQGEHQGLELVLSHWKAARLTEAYTEAMQLDEDVREYIPQMVWDQIDQES